jgi:hypothetical protein
MASLMGHPKPAASLSSGLLARKGQARPAMRPQGFSGFGNVNEAIDDLGWNDMGHGDDLSAAPVAPPRVVEELPSRPVTPPAPVEPPPVLREREALKEEIEAAAPQRSPVALARIGRQVRAKQSGKGKSAFTLRLDDDRHLRLRLASAVSNRSAQLLVTEALDAFLQTLPEVEELASSLPARTGKNKKD